MEQLVSKGALLELRIKEELVGNRKVGQHLVQCLRDSGVQDLEGQQWHKRQDHNSDFEEHQGSVCEMVLEITAPRKGAWLLKIACKCCEGPSQA